MPEPTPFDPATATVTPTHTHTYAADRYIAIKQNLFADAHQTTTSEVPMQQHEKDERIDMQEEEQKAGPIVKSDPHPVGSSHTKSDPYANSMPPPPPPAFHFGSYANRAEWPMRPSATHTRPPLPPSYPTMHHLHAPRPQYDANSTGSRMRGDGFLLDAEDESECLDLSNASDSDPLPMQLNRSLSSGVDDSDRYDADQMERPRSAGPSYTSTAMARTSTGDSAPATLQLVCPSCGEQPAGADAESSFHAHVSKCFIMQLTASPGRRSAAPTPASVGSNGDSGGPIRKTRNRAASAAAATGSAAELASALAMGGQGSVPTTPDTHHGYHPYNGAHGGTQNGLTSTLRQLRRTVDQLDLHQRISIMEAFHRLSRATLAEHAAAAQALTPRGKGKLRSATNSPSPKQKPMEDKVCSNILSLLYSPRLTAPHPSPSFQMSALHLGVPSPLRIGVSHHTHHAALQANGERGEPMETNSVLESGLSSVGGMDTLELGAHAGTTHTPMRKSYLFASSPEPMASPMDEQVFTPNSIMVTDPDGSESVSANSFALTGAFAGALSSGSSSPASSSPSEPPSEQTSPSAPTDSSYSVDRSQSRLERFPSHCSYPDRDGRSEVRSPTNQTSAYCNDEIRNHHHEAIVQA